MTKNRIRSLALHGRNDISVPVKEARQLLEGKPNIKFKVLEQSHFPGNESEFFEIAERIRDFVSPSTFID